MERASLVVAPASLLHLWKRSSEVDPVHRWRRRQQMTELVGPPARPSAVARDGADAINERE
jgi:hypothetical protein